ncbi:hypothetical protein [Pseudochrobactrum sp. MP213Fo]|uniref:hypothetical protein n=1 Tax=Pseudochrobactrum sp. MP213Fo TaxID=3022250 RepID=UPI003BA28AEC
MSCDALLLNKGSCILFEVGFTDGGNAPIDITDDVLSVQDASVTTLEGMVITKSDPVNGIASIFLNEVDAAGIPEGISSSFRIGRDDGNGIITTNKIWVNHK